MPVRGVDCSDPKGGSCIPWDPTSPREVHENVLIRSDLPLMCRGFFSLLLCGLRENKTVRSMSSKADNIYTVRTGLL